MYVFMYCIQVIKKHLALPSNFGNNKDILTIFWRRYKQNNAESDIQKSPAMPTFLKNFTSKNTFIHLFMSK